MPRRGLRPRDRRDQPPPDFKFKSVLVSRLVSKLNYQGKRATAEGVVYRAMTDIEEKIKTDPLEILNKAIENIRPHLEVRPLRSTTLAMRWIIDAARSKTGKPMHVRLSDEILAASRKEGAAFKKREDTHKMAEANRAFAHYRW